MGLNCFAASGSILGFVHKPKRSGLKVILILKVNKLFFIDCLMFGVYFQVFGFGMTRVCKMLLPDPSHVIVQYN